MRKPLTALLLVASVGVLPQGGDARAHAAVPARTGAIGWHPHYRAAIRYARRRAGGPRFAVVEPDGSYHAYHGGRTAIMASTFKVMLLATYLRQHSVRHRQLRRSDRRLLRPMIERSDNVAATRVRDIVGAAAIERLASDAHMRHFHYNSIWGLSRTCARDQARFMYRFERYVPRRHEHFARRLLAHIVPSQRWGIGRVLLHGWRLFFKGGWGTGTGRVDHQVAFLDSHGYRIALAILTEFDPSHTYGKQTLKGIAARLLRGIPRLSG